MNEIGELEGYGVVNYPHGAVRAGFWRDVDIFKGTLADKDFVFNGTFDSDGLLHGYGQQECAGTVQQGLFEHGVATWLATA